MGTIYHIAEIYGWKKNIKFWAVDDKDKLRIPIARYKKFLEASGYCKYMFKSNRGSAASYLTVRVKDNIVEEVTAIDIKDFVMEYLSSLPIEEFKNTSRQDVIGYLIKNANQYFSQQFLEFLITKDLEFKNDTMESGFLYFDNGYIEVMDEGIYFNDYDNLDGYIWQKQKINREFEEIKIRSDFEDFIYNIVKKKDDRYEALKSVIGFLLHTFKDANIAKAIIFIDEKLSEGAFGRSGKGLVMKAIGKIRNTVILDGRNFSPSKNFAFQRVNADTNIVAIEDIGEKFSFEKLYSLITDGFTIEKKNKDEIFLGFNEAPKIVISSNYTISGIDDSTLDRQFIIEFSDFYNMQHRPYDDFGKLFFDGWDKTEWCSFDNFMVECLQYYLKNGLKTYEHVNLDHKRLINETCQEFVEFSETIELNKDYEKKVLFEKFKEENTDYDKLTQAKFTRWLKAWAKVKGYDCVESKSGTIRKIGFRDGKKRAA